MCTYLMGPADELQVQLVQGGFDNVLAEGVRDPAIAIGGPAADALVRRVRPQQVAPKPFGAEKKNGPGQVTENFSQQQLRGDMVTNCPPYLDIASGEKPNVRASLWLAHT